MELKNGRKQRNSFVACGLCVRGKSVKPGEDLCVGLVAGLVTNSPTLTAPGARKIESL